LGVDDDDDDDEGRINFSMALSPKTTRTRNNKLETVKSRNSSQCNGTFLVMSVRLGKKFGFQSAAENLQRRQ